MRALRTAGVALLCLAAAAGCRNPQLDAAIYQQLNDAADQFAMVRYDMATMQAQLDSVRGVVAKQDTLIRRLANLAGYPIPPGESSLRY